MTTMELHTEVRLPLPPGRYQLNVTQDMNVAGTQPLTPRTHHLEIDVPRLSMSGTEVFSVTPPPNARGPFAGRLAQITLRRRALPWARSGANGPPWMALVVLGDGEGELISGVSAPEAYTEGVYDELTDPPPATAKADTLSVVQPVVDRVFPAKSELHLTSHVREVETANTEYADEDGWVSVVIANRLPQPGQRYHAYLISTEGQHESLPTPGAVASEVDFTWALADFVVEFVVANGIDAVSPPLAELILTHADTSGVDRDALGTALLDAAQPSSLTVDARGDVVRGDASPRLVTDDVGTARAARSRRAGDAGAPGTTRSLAMTTAEAGLTVASVYAEVLAAVAAEQEYRFPVLAHWEFECSDEGRDFAGYMSRLDVGMVGADSKNRFEKEDDEGSGELTRGERAGVDTAAHRPVVQPTGHIALQHTDRAGVAQRSWYRGPLTPAKITRGAAGTPAHVADQLLALTEDGRWDTSYASAFEIGRLLAMSDLQFLRSLRAYARAGFVIRRRRKLYGAELSDLVGVSLDIDRFLRFDDELRTVIDRSLVPGGLGVDPLVAIGEPLHVQSGPTVLPADEVNVLATGFGLEVTAVGGVLATGPSTVAPAPGRDEFLAFDDLLAEGASVTSGVTRDAAITERLRGIEAAVESAGGIDVAATRLRDLLGDF